ncbi:MAG: dipeptide epimerase [Saprospiraceae bacterium]
MQLSCRPVLWQLRHPFRIATGMRTHTQAVLTEIRLGDTVGYGEASMPPYYGETHETATAFLEQVKAVLQKESAPFSTAAIMETIDAIAPGHHAAKASVDIALHDLLGKLEDRPVWQLLGAEPARMPPTSFTLGIDTPEVLREKLTEAAGFQILKVKLGTSDDKAIIRTVREISDKPIYADANQGWNDPEAALDLIHWLAEQNVCLIEQPTPKDDLDAAAWIAERSPLPVIADESFQRLQALDRVKEAFHGVNIKLMKCTGLGEGLRIVRAAREQGLKVMIGCMTESSCGIMAAAALAPYCDFADIDGCWLIGNNPFDMPMLSEGCIELNARPGLGLTNTLQAGH